MSLCSYWTFVVTPGAPQGHPLGALGNKSRLEITIDSDLKSYKVSKFFLQYLVSTPSHHWNLIKYPIPTPKVPQEPQVN